MDDGGFAGTVAEGAGAGGGEAAFVAGSDVRGGNAADGGDVNDAAGHGGGGAVEEERLEADGHVEDGFDVHSEDLVPTCFGEVVVGRAPSNTTVVQQHS